MKPTRSGIPSSKAPCAISASRSTTPSASRSRSNSEPTSRPFLSAGPRLTHASQPRFAGLLLPNAGSRNRYRPLDLLDSEARTCPIAAPQLFLRYRSVYAPEIPIAALPTNKAVDTGTVSYPLDRKRGETFCIDDL